MAPSFISLLMGADKRAAPADTIIVPPQSSRPHLVRGRSARVDNSPFVRNFERPPFGQPQAAALQVGTTAHWNDKQRVQDFFRYTSRSDLNNCQGATKEAKAAPTDYKAIDLTWRRGSDSRASTTSFSSLDDTPDDFHGVLHGRGRLQSALEELQATDQAQEVKERGNRTTPRRRYDSFDILADVRLSEEVEADDVDSVPSTPARSRANSEDFYGAGLLDMLSQRHMPVGMHRYASVAEMLGNDGRASSPKAIENNERDRERPALCGPEAVLETHTVLAELAQERTEVDRIQRLPAAQTKAFTSLGEACPKQDSTNVATPLSTLHQEQCPSTQSVEDGPIPLRAHPTYQKYFQMLKVGLPSSVVKHKMQSENVDPAILDLDPSAPLSAPLAATFDKAATAYAMQLKEYRAKHGKYVQMVKVGLPQAVVEHKMRMDGVDPAWLQGPPQRMEAPKSVAITDEERVAHRKKYHKYFHMLRLGLPRGAVEQKMRMAGLDPVELNGPQLVTQANVLLTKTLKRTNSIRKKLHWEGKKHQQTRRDSLWGGDAVDKAKDAVQISKESRALLEHLFVQDLSTTKKRTAKSETKGVIKTTKAMAQLIDLKKSQNIAITLARVKVSFSELKRELLAMNPTVLSSSQVQSLMDMWPDRKEMEAIHAFNGDVAALGSAEQFLLEVRTVPRFQEKLRCFVFKQEFSSRVHELHTSLTVVIQGVDQVCSSTALRQVFIYILQIGNLLNVGADDEQGVDAFSLASLVKFSQTKAFVGGITFLQYVVQSIERDVPHLAHFYHDINLIAKCSKVAYASLASEKIALEAGLQKLVREAEASDSNDTLRGFRDAVLMFCEEGKIELEALESQLNELNAAKAHFLEYFEEEETEEELNVLLSHISNFTDEYCREHCKYQAQMKTQLTHDPEMPTCKVQREKAQEKITTSLQLGHSPSGCSK